MNERIKQLQFQAAAQIPPLLVDSEWQREFVEKFAELLLLECADIMDGRDENGNAKDGQYLLTQFDIDASQRYA